MSNSPEFNAALKGVLAAKGNVAAITQELDGFAQDIAAAAYERGMRDENETCATLAANNPGRDLPQLIRSRFRKAMD